MRKALLALMIVPAAALVSDAGAQTGHAPKASSKWSIPAAGATSPAKPPKPCLQYGQGFYQLPGTDTCVKISGDVRVDVSVGNR